jgi:GntR family carbon starvation induced transcriptional regulator
METDDQSITGRAYQLLRAQIIGCALKPGSRLNISSLQTSLSLSQASVREALSRLTAEGLVEIERHRGFRVAPVSAGGFRELTEACITVELPLIRSAIANGGLEWERQLIAAYHRAAQTLQQVVAGDEGVEAYSTERQNFYEVLLSAADNKWLLWSWRLLYAQNMRYRHMYMPLARVELEQLPKHEEILQAVLKRDIAKVERMAIANYDQVMSVIEKTMAGGTNNAPPAERPRRRRAA